MKEKIPINLNDIRKDKKDDIKDKFWWRGLQEKWLWNENHLFVVKQNGLNEQNDVLQRSVATSSQTEKIDVYFRDLLKRKQDHLLKNFNANRNDPKLDTVPLYTIARVALDEKEEKKFFGCLEKAAPLCLRCHLLADRDYFKPEQLYMFKTTLKNKISARIKIELINPHPDHLSLRYPYGESFLQQWSDYAPFQFNFLFKYKKLPKQNATWIDKQNAKWVEWTYNYTELISILKEYDLCDLFMKRLYKLPISLEKKLLLMS
jgi:hypothetical protein